MPKNILQDMVKVKRTDTKKNQSKPDLGSNILKKDKVEIPVRVVSKPKPILDKKELEAELFNRPKQRVSLSDEIGSNKDRSSKVMWTIAAFSVGVLIFAISLLFVEAKITISPHVEEITLNDNLSAVRDSKTDGLYFDLVSLSGEDEKVLEAESNAEVSIPAKGTVVIYNEYSSQSQLLDINTRLEGSNGKIYKTEKKVTVPGKKSDGTPGSVEVGIYASEPGQSYNSGPLDFKIFGFKGTPKYAKFYARSKNEIAGGKQGLFPTISDEAKNTAINELKDSLKAKLSAKVKSQIPDSFVMLPGAAFLQVDKLDEAVDETKNTLTLSMKGTISGILFDTQTLSKILAKNKISSYKDESVYIKDFANVVFDLSGDEKNIRDSRNVAFSLTGPIEIVFKVDEKSILSDLLGQRKKDFNNIMSKYTNIDSANLILKPFWHKSIPEKSEDVKILVNYN